MSEKIVFLNGAFLPLSGAKVSVLDRGFLFGDGVYEVLPVYHGQIFRLPEHLARLKNSLSGIRLESPWQDDQWQLILEDLLRQNGATQGNWSIYLQITRGEAPHRDHIFPQTVTPTVFLMVSPLTPLKPEWLQEGISAITMEDIRWQWCHIKAITLLANVLMRQEAVEQQGHEAVLVREGYIHEGAASNLFMVLQGKLITPPKSAYLLPGITRDLVLELAAKAEIPSIEAEMPYPAFQQADEIWLTSSTKEVLPITSLNHKPIGEGKPGPYWRKVYDLYQDFKCSFS